MLKRYQVILEGMVQGVGMRYFCTLQAEKMHLTGSVKNLANGMVEIFVQGEERAIDNFLIQIQTGNRFSKVEDIKIKSIPVVPGEKHFVYVW